MSGTRASLVIILTFFLIAASACGPKQARSKTVEQLILELKRLEAALTSQGAEGEPSGASRKAACEALATFHAEARPAVPVLLNVAQTDPVLLVRLSAIQTLGAIGPDASNAVPVLLGLLKENPDPFTRLSIAKSIPKLAAGDANLMAELLQLMQSRDLSLAEHAWAMLGELGRQQDVPENTLLDLLRRQTNSIRRMSLVSSTRGRPISQEVLKLVEPGLESTNFFLKLGTLKALAKTEPSAAVRLLEDPDALVRLTAAQNLAKSESTRSNAIPVLEKLLEETNAILRRGAVATLGKFEPTRNKAIAGLIKLLGETKSTNTSAKELRNVGPQSSPSVRSHRFVLDDIAAFGASGSNALAALNQECDDPNNAFRFDAAIARLKINKDCDGVRTVFALVDRGFAAPRIRKFARAVVDACRQ